jgi:hypothetical protein
MSDCALIRPKHWGWGRELAGYFYFYNTRRRARFPNGLMFLIVEVKKAEPDAGPYVGLEQGSQTVAASATVHAMESAGPPCGALTRVHHS